MEIEAHTNGVVEVAKAAPKWSLLLCDRDAVKKFWPTVIRPGLVRIKEKDKNSGYWQPEHVRHRLEAGLAGQIICECFLILQSNKGPVGFIVTQAFNDEFIGVPMYLHQWIIWCEGAPFWKVLPDIEPQMIERAKGFGLRGLTGISSRPQWMRRVLRRGYRVHQYFFRKDFY
jgi:hypothetical protein